MATQRTLFGDPGIPEPPHNGTETSWLAAESVKTFTGRLRLLILEYLKQQPDGATCDQCEEALHLSHQTCSARIRELSQGGAIYHDGQRPTRSGRAARIYRVKGEQHER